MSKRHFNQKGFTLVELVISLSIFIVTFSLAVYGVVSFKQSIEVTNAAKEMMLNIRKARRFALDGVVTQEGTASSYYIYIDSEEDNYSWGECKENGGCALKNTLKSNQYRKVSISNCIDSSGSSYNKIEFLAITGKFVISGPGGNKENGFCDIELKNSTGFISTTRKVRVDLSGRTIRLVQ